MCLVLNMWEFWIFVSFRKNDCFEYDQDAITGVFWTGFQVCQIFAYASIPRSSEYAYGWIMPYGRVLNMSGQPFTGF